MHFRTSFGIRTHEGSEEKHEWTINMAKLFSLAELNRACQEHSGFRMYEAMPEVDDQFTHF